MINMRPDDGRLNLWPVAVIVFLAILGVGSITPVVRLDSSPPKDFLTLRTNAKGSNAEEAKGYWETAVKVLQWKYDRTRPLPEQPPQEFTLGTTNYTDSPQEQAARSLYWTKLRQEWVKAENWHRTIDFSVSWIIADLQWVSQGIHDFIVDHT